MPLVIDPYDLNHPWDAPRLEAWILFGICVANKPAAVTAQKLSDFLDTVPGTASPFEKVRYMIRAGCLTEKLHGARFGQYKRIEKAFRQAVEIQDVLGVTLERLEEICGLGMKTSRMIMLYYKPETRCAPLDTHVLKWLRAQGYDAPKGTPSGKKYRDLEAIFLREADARGMTPKQLDTAVWQMYARPNTPRG